MLGQHHMLSTVCSSYTLAKTKNTFTVHLPNELAERQYMLYSHIRVVQFQSSSHNCFLQMIVPVMIQPGVMHHSTVKPLYNGHAKLALK